VLTVEQLVVVLELFVVVVEEYKLQLVELVHIVVALVELFLELNVDMPLAVVLEHILLCIVVVLEHILLYIVVVLVRKLLVHTFDVERLFDVVLGVVVDIFHRLFVGVLVGEADIVEQ
jgi:hypothetical protein